jgi:hypothetical protein
MLQLRHARWARTFCCAGGCGAGSPAALPLDARLMAASALSAKLWNSGAPAGLGDIPRALAGAPRPPPSSGAAPGLYRNCCIMLRPFAAPAPQAAAAAINRRVPPQRERAARPHRRALAHSRAS